MNTKEPPRPPCPKCKPPHRVWKKGVTPTLQGEFQRYICFKCGRTFYAPDHKNLRIVSKYATAGKGTG